MKKNDNLIGLILAFAIITFSIYHSINKTNDIIKNGIKTQAKIIDEYYIGGKHYIQYEFFVGKKKYTGEEKTAKFKCNDGTLCCVGKNFVVTYSSKNPNNSFIDLGKYNKYKSRTNLYDILK